MRALIVTNGQINDLDYLNKIILSHDYVICVDGAARYLHRIQKKPDLMVGDMDSVHEVDMIWIESSLTPVNRYETRKDFTDTELAIEVALDKNPELITIVGAVGSRLDHSLSNIFLLKKIADAGVEGQIDDGDFEVLYLWKDKQLNWKRGEVVSFVPTSESEIRVTLEGFEYPLFEKRMTQGTSLCISNVVKKDNPIIKIVGGGLLAIRNKKPLI